MKPPKICVLILCIFIAACQIDTGSGDVSVSDNLLGKWGLHTSEKSAKPVEIVRVSPTHILLAGTYFDIQKIEYTAAASESARVQESGTIYTRSPGKPALFSTYRIERITAPASAPTKNRALYLEGGGILSVALSSRLVKLGDYDSATGENTNTP